MYSYYVVAKQIDNITGKTITSAQSNIVKTLLNSKENISNLIEKVKEKFEKNIKPEKKKKFFNLF